MERIKVIDTCPKCGYKLRFRPGGLHDLDASEGVGQPVYPHVTCIMCGFFRELDVPPVCKFREKNKTNQPTGIVKFVKDNYTKLEEMKYTQKLSWKEIVEQFRKITKDKKAVSNVASVADQFRKQFNRHKKANQ